MGQNNSRARNPITRPPAAASTEHDRRTTDDRPSSSGSASSSSTAQEIFPVTANKPTRRSKVRRSLTNLVQPYTPTSVRSRMSSAVDTTRQSWRNSKRWSKSPQELGPSTEIAPVAGPSTAPPSPVIEKGKEAERDPDSFSIESSHQDGHDRPSTPFPAPITESPSDSPSEGSTRVDHEISQSLGSWLGGQTSTQDRPVSPIEKFVILTIIPVAHLTFYLIQPHPCRTSRRRN